MLGPLKFLYFERISGQQKRMFAQFVLAIDVAMLWGLFGFSANASSPIGGITWGHIFGALTLLILLWTTDRQRGI